MIVTLDPTSIPMPMRRQPWRDVDGPREGQPRQGSARRTHDPRLRDTYTGTMTRLHRITQDPDVMGGRPGIRGLRVTVGT